MSDDAATNASIARLPQVRASVHDAAEQIGATARQRLSQHTATGKALVEVVHFEVDSRVDLIDPNALAIEFGRRAYTTKSGAQVGAAAPLHILTGSL